MNKRTKIAITLFPLIFIASMLWLRSTNYPIYEIIGREDHLIEWMQFFLFLTSGIVAICLALKVRKLSTIIMILYLLLGVGLIFVAKEEISWGERVLNVEAPAIFDGETEIPVLQTNVQSEMNLHNFEPIHKLVGTAYILIATYAIFSYFIKELFFKIKTIKKENKFLISLLTPEPYLILYFLPLYINFVNVRPRPFAPQDYEMTEFLLSLGFLIFTLINLERVKKQLKKEE